MTQPALFVRGLADGLVSNRVALYENSPVLALTREDGAWLATTPAGVVCAPKAILAVNGHAESFGFFRRRLMHVFTYASMTRALTADEVARLDGAPRWALTPADPMWARRFGASPAPAAGAS
jgi:glycine/D-amino acid oxidase-like deaminating enzyme